MYKVELSAHTKKHIRAAGQVFRKMPIPILVHTEMGTATDEIVDVLEQAGIPPRFVMLCHTDRNPDLYVHRRLAEHGVFLQYDTPSRIKYQPEHLVIKLMRDLFDAGLGEHILLGDDMARRSYWKAYGGGPGVDYLLVKIRDNRACVRCGLFDGRRQRFGVDVERRDRCPFCRKVQGRHTPNAAACTCDNDNFVVQTVRHRLQSFTVS